MSLSDYVDVMFGNPIKVDFTQRTKSIIQHNTIKNKGKVIYQSFRYVSKDGGISWTQTQHPDK
jgi:hypothetical protein